MHVLGAVLLKQMDWCGLQQSSILYASCIVLQSNSLKVRSPHMPVCISNESCFYDHIIRFCLLIIMHYMRPT